MDYPNFSKTGIKLIDKEGDCELVKVLHLAFGALEEAMRYRDLIVLDVGIGLAKRCLTTIDKLITLESKNLHLNGLTGEDIEEANLGADRKGADVYDYMEKKKELSKTEEYDYEKARMFVEHPQTPSVIRDILKKRVCSN